jgi:small conductance mechanosensitive channel
MAFDALTPAPFQASAIRETRPMDGIDVTNVKELGGAISVFVTQLTAWAATALPSLIGALLLLIFGWWIAARADRGIRRLLSHQSSIDLTLSGVIASLVRYAILILVVVAVLGQLGIQTTSILAALGAAGLAIGLAMQGTLSNIAAGMMLLWLRPFRVGDFIDNGTSVGAVTEVGLFATELLTYDGIYVFVPNSDLWNRKLINYSRMPTRLVDLKFGVAYGDDIAKGKKVLLDMALAEEMVNKTPEPYVFVDELADSAVVLRLRCWTANADYWTVFRAFTENGKAGLEAAGLSIPFPQRDLYLKEAPAGARDNAA